MNNLPIFTPGPTNCQNIRSGDDCIDRDLPPVQWCAFCAAYALQSFTATVIMDASDLQ